MHETKHTPHDNGTQAVFGRGWLAKEHGMFRSERAVAGGLQLHVLSQVETL
jgi:hypothetical protein